MVIVYAIFRPIGNSWSRSFSEQLYVSSATSMNLTDEFSFSEFFDKCQLILPEKRSPEMNGFCFEFFAFLYLLDEKKEMINYYLLKQHTHYSLCTNVLLVVRANDVPATKMR